MDTLSSIVISAFWFFLPAGVANMAPTFFGRLPFLATPADLGKKFRGQPIFGANKTYRGLIAGVIFAVLTVYLQRQLYPWPHGYTLVNYQNINLWLLGFLLGFGALGGDLVKSFIKRRLKIPSGWVWAPFDQLDWIIGAVLLSSVVVVLPVRNILAAIVVFGLLHPLVNLIGYALKIKPNKL